MLLSAPPPWAELRIFSLGGPAAGPAKRLRATARPAQPAAIGAQALRSDLRIILSCERAAPAEGAPPGMPMDVYGAEYGSYHVEVGLPGVDQ
jgi:hypothetical protein